VTLFLAALLKRRDPLRTDFAVEVDFFTVRRVAVVDAAARRLLGVVFAADLRDVSGFRAGVAIKNTS